MIKFNKNGIYSECFTMDQFVQNVLFFVHIFVYMIDMQIESIIILFTLTFQDSLYSLVTVIRKIDFNYKKKSY